MRPRAVLMLLLIFLAASCLLLPLPVDAAPRTIVVPDDNASIQGAINIAAEGDTIFVKKGTYTQDTIVIGKAVTLVGEDTDGTILRHKDLPPWNGQLPIPTATTIQVDANLAVIINFTVENLGTAIAINGYLNLVANNIIAEGEGGITITGLNNTIVQNLILRNNQALTCSGSYNNITGNNIIDPGPDGLSIKGPSNTVYGNVITAGSGFGSINVYSNQNTIVKNNITGSGIIIHRGSSNNIHENRVNDGVGLLLYVGNDNVFYANHLANNYRGILVGGASGDGPWVSGNTLFHNNFINNTLQVGTNWQVYGKNSFDDAGEGNYWSDYTGSDANNDGIGDTPYVIDETRRDNFPLMFPWGPWDISVSSPVNQSYSGGVPLVFMVDRLCSWFGYSIDGLSNVTVSGNTTISDLSEGWHTVTVYTNDTLGNAGSSETISFYVEAQAGLLQTLFVGVAAIAAAGFGIVVYARKHRRNQQQNLGQK